MSAPYIIPFNFQPVLTIIDSVSDYTVPAGKYARVDLSNCLLPVLNSVNLYTNKPLTGTGKQIELTATPFSAPLKDAHRINITKDSNVDILRINFSEAAVAASNRDLDISGASASGSYTFASPTDTNYFSMMKSATIGTSATVTADVCSIKSLWLKAGDVLTWASGQISYTEYNEIS